MAPLCTRTPTAPPVGGARPSSGGAHRAEQQANEQQTVPLCARTPTPHLSVGTSELRAAHIGPSKTAPNCACSNSHAPTFRRGTSELQVSMHSGPRADARCERGVGDARGDGSWRLLEDKNWSSHCRWPNTPGYDSPGRNVSCALSVKNSGGRVIEQVTCNIEQSCKKRSNIVIAAPVTWSKEESLTNCSLID